MTEGRPSQPVVTVKPQSDIYTFLIILAIVALAVGVGFALYNLLSVNGYGGNFWDIFKSQPTSLLPPPAAV
ncbi:MAG: hypothetical protein LLG01_18620 [Planctomycetaceae bacterium]|nr:hypothetical protein [Planctomycetaceae bacterium]